MRVKVRTEWKKRYHQGIICKK